MYVPMYVVGFQTIQTIAMVIMDLWGMTFYDVVVFSLFFIVLFHSICACCVLGFIFNMLMFFSKFENPFIYFRAKFGAEITGTTQSSIFSISKSQISKRRVTKKFDRNRGSKTFKRKRKSKSDEEISGQKLIGYKINLDHRKYGAWYLHPSKWESRFQSLSDPKSIEIIKERRIPKADKHAGKQDVAAKKVISTIFDSLFLVKSLLQHPKQLTWLGFK